MRVLACACTPIFACYVDCRVAACYTTQSHASLLYTQVFNNVLQSHTESHAVHFPGTMHSYW